MCYFASSYLAGRVAALGCFDKPFSVVDRARIYAELDGDLGSRLADDVARYTGYRVLGFWDNGFRHISNRLRPIRHPGDCRGMRIRTLDNAMYQRVLGAMGFTPMVIDVKDLVRAVETQEVDAQENPLTNTMNFGLHHTHKHLSLTSHFHGVALLLANRAWFEALAPGTQSALLAASAKATAAQRQFATAEDALCLEQLRRDRCRGGIGGKRSTWPRSAPLSQASAIEILQSRSRRHERVVHFREPDIAKRHLVRDAALAEQQRDRFSRD